jgi:hypothetical protein
MKFHPVTATLASIAVVASLQGCAALAGNHAQTRPANMSRIPAADPLLDQYIAWVPRDQAQTAAVAEALTHISLANAREQTAKQLCAGNRFVKGEVTEVFGPLPASAPANAGGYSAWYYRISMRPGIHGCHSMKSQKLYHTLQEHLPEWIDIEAASTAALTLTE